MIRNIMKVDSLKLLQSLKGQKLKFTTGAGLTQNLMTDVFAVVTDCQVLTLEGKLEIIDLPENEEEMSSFEINGIGATKTSEIVEANTHFFYFKGEPVKDIFITRERISCFTAGFKNWDYLSDVGIMIELPSGFISVYRRTHYDEVLSAIFTRTRPELGDTTTDSLFESTLIAEYQVTRTEFPLDELINEVSLD